MKLEGSLDAFSLPDIFQLLSFTKKSGGLRLRHGAADGVVYFADGSVTGASADGVRQALARRLIGSGVVDDDALERAVGAVGAGQGIGPWLVDNGIVDSEVVRQAATEQTMDSVFDLLRWPAGDFAFNVDVANPDDVGVRLAPDVVVTEATQRQASWDAVASVIPGPDAVLSMPVVLTGDPTVTREEWALLALVDGRRRVGDLVELTGCGQFAVVSTLAALVGRGLLRVSDTDDHVATVTRRQALLGPLEGTPLPLLASVPDLSDDDSAELPTIELDDVDVADVAGVAPVEAGEESDVTEDRTDTSDTADTDEHDHHVNEDDGSAAEAAEDVADDEAPDAASDEAAVEASEPAVAPVENPAPAEPDLVGSGAGVATSSGARAPGPVLARAHVPGDVVPTRPEPFLPSRRPDHPEAPAARLTGLPAMNQTARAAVAAEPEASGLIERDPSVNRSLLLRLIAGVRGL